MLARPAALCKNSSCCRHTEQGCPAVIARHRTVIGAAKAAALKQAQQACCWHGCRCSHTKFVHPRRPAAQRPRSCTKVAPLLQLACRHHCQLLQQDGYVSAGAGCDRVDSKSGHTQRQRPGSRPVQDQIANAAVALLPLLQERL